MEARSNVVLSESSDWDGWLLEVRVRANGFGLWDLIDPFHNTKPQGLSEPERPQKHYAPGSKEEDRYQRDLDWKIYQIDLDRYEKEQKNLASISQYILEHLSSQLFSCIAYRIDDPHPWDLLHILVPKVAPNCLIRERIVDKEIEDLKAITPQDEDVLEWLDRWDLAMAQAHNCYSRNGSRRREAFDDICAKFPVEASAAKERASDMVIASTTATGMASFFLELFLDQFLDEFRTVWKEGLLLNCESQAGTEQCPERTTLQMGHSANSKRTPLCLCGNFEYYSECLYLNRALRPPNWIPDPARQEMVAVSLTDPAVADKVDRALLRWKQIQARKKSSFDDDKSSVSTIALWPEKP